jgi:hypothetical protein
MLPESEPEVAEEFFARLADLAEFTAIGRSNVRREGADKAIVGQPVPESAPRLAQQLCQLTKGSARLSRRSLIQEEDFKTAARAAFDCIPARRRLMLAPFTTG